MNVHMYITHSFVVILEWRWMIGHLWLRRCGTGARVNTRTIIITAVIMFNITIEDTSRGTAATPFLGLHF